MQETPEQTQARTEKETASLLDEPTIVTSLGRLTKDAFESMRAVLSGTKTKLRFKKFKLEKKGIGQLAQIAKRYPLAAKEVEAEVLRRLNRKNTNAEK